MNFLKLAPQRDSHELTNDVLQRRSLSYSFFSFRSYVLNTTMGERRQVPYRDESELPPDRSLERVRFRGRYRILWKNARAELQRYLHFGFPYTWRLTRWILRYAAVWRKPYTQNFPTGVEICRTYFWYMTCSHFWIIQGVAVDERTLLRTFFVPGDRLCCPITLAWQFLFRYTNLPSIRAVRFFRTRNFRKRFYQLRQRMAQHHLEWDMETASLWFLALNVQRDIPPLHPSLYRLYNWKFVN